MADIRTIGVLGAGQMGGGIAQVAATASYDVKLADASIELAQKGKAKIDAILGKQVEKAKITADQKNAIVSRRTPNLITMVAPIMDLTKPVGALAIMPSDLSAVTSGLLALPCSPR